MAKYTQIDKIYVVNKYVATIHNIKEYTRSNTMANPVCISNHFAERTRNELATFLCVIFTLNIKSKTK